MLKCTGKEGVSEPFLSSMGGPWGVLLGPSSVCVSQETQGPQLSKGNNEMHPADYWGIWWFKSQEPWSWSLPNFYTFLPSFIKDDLAPQGPRVSAGPQTVMSRAKHSSVQSLRRVRLFGTPWTAAGQASLFFTISRSPPKPMSMESVKPSNHLILCRPLLLPPSIFPSIRVFSSESALSNQVAKALELQLSI